MSYHAKPSFSAILNKISFRLNIDGRNFSEKVGIDHLRLNQIRVGNTNIREEEIKGIFSSLKLKKTERFSLIDSISMDEATKENFLSVRQEEHCLFVKKLFNIDESGLKNFPETVKYLNKIGVLDTKEGIKIRPSSAPGEILNFLIKDVKHTDEKFLEELRKNKSLENFSYHKLLMAKNGLGLLDEKTLKIFAKILGIKNKKLFVNNWIDNTRRLAKSEVFSDLAETTFNITKKESNEKIKNGLEKVSCNQSILRDDQKEVARSLLENIAGYHQAADAAIMPTGWGKTVLFGKIIEQTKLPAFVLVPRKELINQTYKRFVESGFFKFTENDIGKISLRGTSRTQLLENFAKPVVIMTGSLYLRMVRKGLINIDDRPLIIADELHRYAGPLYAPIMRSASKKSTLLGFTATKKINGRNILETIYGKKKPAYEAPVIREIEKGNLSPIKQFAVLFKVDNDSINIQNGEEYTHRELKEIVDREGRDQAATDFFWFGKKGSVSPLYDKNSLWFCHGVEHARRVAGKLNSQFADLFPDSSQNYKFAEVVSGKTNHIQLRKTLSDFRDGKIKALINADLLIEGIDDPSIESVFVVRPTRSEALLTQMVGRGLRKKDGKVLKVVSIVDSNDPYALLYSDILGAFQVGVDEIPSSLINEEEILTDTQHSNKTILSPEIEENSKKEFLKEKSVCQKKFVSKDEAIVNAYVYSTVEEITTFNERRIFDRKIIESDAKTILGLTTFGDLTKSRGLLQTGMEKLNQVMKDAYIQQVVENKLEAITFKRPDIDENITLPSSYFKLLKKSGRDVLYYTLEGADYIAENFYKREEQINYDKDFTIVTMSRKLGMTDTKIRDIYHEFKDQFDNTKNEFLHSKLLNKYIPRKNAYYRKSGVVLTFCLNETEVYTFRQVFPKYEDSKDFPEFKSHVQMTKEISVDSKKLMTLYKSVRNNIENLNDFSRENKIEGDIYLGDKIGIVHYEFTIDKDVKILRRGPIPITTININRKDYIDDLLHGRVGKLDKIEVSFVNKLESSSQEIIREQKKFSELPSIKVRKNKKSSDILEKGENSSYRYL